jgi:hypothetical protein
MSKVLMDSDMAHTLSINRNPLHQYNITMKLTKTLQFWCISCGYSNPQHSQQGIWHEESWPWCKTIKTSKTNIDQYKLSRPRYYISNSLFHHSLAHYLVHRFPIARYCLRFAPLLHYCIIYCFFICNVPWKILNRATDVILSPFSLLLSL